jgi:uncharacterized protein (DUF427 family)
VTAGVPAAHAGGGRDDRGASHEHTGPERLDEGLGGLRHEPTAKRIRANLGRDTLLPTRFYLPREDLRVEVVDSATRTTCAYKGHASYVSPVVNGAPVPDLAWTYEEPLREAAEVAGLVAFFDEHVDVMLDGTPRPRPITPWSDRPPAS